MAKRTERLTALKVKSLSKPGRYGDGHNLYLQITDAGVRSWLLRYRDPSGALTEGGRPKEKWLGLGPVHTYTLAEARERARDARKLIDKGYGPPRS